ncbi:MAG: galactokinase [Chthonomonadales bacterium]
MDMADLVTTSFRSAYGKDPRFVVLAPGRVNLIGEHTDYNDGYVLPTAIDRTIAIAAEPRADRMVRAYSGTFGERCEFNLDDLSPSDRWPWSNYIRGVAQILQGEKHSLVGLDLCVDGDIPIGSGLSSSAALEVASCLAFEAASGFDVGPVARALLCRRAEREFVGVQCGIMDQFVCSLGREGHALFLDTRSLDFEAVPLGDHGYAIAVADTGKRRSLVHSAYNTRRAECEAAVEAIRAYMPWIRALRDVDEELFAHLADDLPDVLRRRARHVITENGRVLRSVAALKNRDLARFGALMTESHRSLRDDYEVSTPELDLLVEAALEVEGVVGSRMTGAGFGGCTVSLVHKDALAEFRDHLDARYSRSVGQSPDVLICTASAGASRVR